MKYFKSVILVLVLIGFFVSGCTMPKREVSESSNSEEGISNWRFEYVQPNQKAVEAYKDKKDTSNSRPFDGIVLKSGKNQGLVVENCFVQNEQGSNLVIIPKSGTTGVRAFLAGIGGTAKNVAPALTLGLLQYEAAKQQSDTTIVTADGGDGGEAAATATTGP